MKATTTKKLFLAMAVAAGIGGGARADFCYPFDTIPWDPCITGPWTWDSTYQAIQATPTNGCTSWVVGGPKIDFCWPVQTNMQAIANTGIGHVSFDVSVHDSSFVGGNWTNGSWYQIHYAGNSDGAQGWTPDGAGIVSGTYSASGPNDHTWHFELAFIQMGWEPGDTWFQILWLANSDCDKTLQFYIANVCVFVPPEVGLQKVGDSVVLTWTNAQYTLQAAPEVSGTYTNIPGATSPYTNPVNGSQLYFRLMR